jgi:hypothetical protein
MNISKKTGLLGAAIAALVTIGAAVPASADTFRASFYAGEASPGIVSIHYQSRDNDRFDRLRYEQHRRAMFWAMKHRHAGHHFDHRVVDRDYHVR